MSFGYIAQAAEYERNRRFQNEQNQKRLDLSRDQLDFNKQLAYDQLDFQKDQWGYRKGLMDYDFEKMKASDVATSDAISTHLSNIDAQRQYALDKESWEKEMFKMDPKKTFGKGLIPEWLEKKVAPYWSFRNLVGKGLTYEKDIAPDGPKYKEISPSHKLKGKGYTLEDLAKWTQIYNMDPSNLNKPTSELLEKYKIAAPKVGENNNKDQQRSLWNQYGNIDYQKGYK